MPDAHRTEADFQLFLETLKSHPDDLIISMAVLNRVVTPAGPFGQRTRQALVAEAERRGLSPVVDILAEAAIAQGAAMVADEAGS